MKKIIIAAVIIFFILVGIVGSMDEDPADKKRQVTKKPKVTVTVRPTVKPTVKPTAKKPKKQKNVLIDTLQKRPVLNGMGDKVIGKYGYIKLIESNFKLLCTDKILIDFVNFLNKQNLLYVIIDFDDGTGLHGIKTIWSYCEIGKDSNGIFEGGPYLGDIRIYTDSKKVDRSHAGF
jgi:hypothetical protein